MTDGINRKPLARSFLLSERVGDKRLVREIRRYARGFGRRGRPFKLPRDLDLEGCLAALAERLEDEHEHLDAIADQMVEAMDVIKRKFDAKERQAWMRIWTLQLILRVAHLQPEKSPGSDDS